MEKIYYPALQQIFGNKKLKELLDQYLCPKMIWDMTLKKEVPLSPAERKRINLDLEGLEKRLTRLNISYTYLGSSDYPEKLASISEPPVVLYYRGNLSLLKSKGIALVGTRKVSTYGRLVAEKLSRGLYPYFTIISGLARGIDYHVHASIPPDRAIAVLGTGVDVFYPQENKGLQDSISQQGLVLSELPPGTSPKPWQFPWRNRIISGLAEGIVVVEAQSKSGSLITAELGLEQGRDVFAVPGRIFDDNSQGTNQLIKEGAKLVNGPEDILEEYFPSTIFKSEELAKIDRGSTEGKIIDLLREKDSSFQEILNNVRVPVSVLQQNLTLLELEGKVKKLPGLKYGIMV